MSQINTCLCTLLNNIKPSLWSFHKTYSNKEATLATVLTVSLGSAYLEDENFEAQLLPYYCLANLIKALPVCKSILVYYSVILILCSIITEILYIDLAEQTLLVSLLYSLDYSLFTQFLSCRPSKRYQKNTRVRSCARVAWLPYWTIWTSSPSPFSVLLCKPQQTAAVTSHLTTLQWSRTSGQLFGIVWVMPTRG